MSPEMIGGISGAVFGFINLVALLKVADYVELKQKNREEARMIAKVIRWLAYIDLVLFTLIGYWLGPLALS